MLYWLWLLRHINRNSLRGSWMDLRSYSGFIVNLVSLIWFLSDTRRQKLGWQLKSLLPILYTHNSAVHWTKCWQRHTSMFPVGQCFHYLLSWFSTLAWEHFLISTRYSWVWEELLVLQVFIRNQRTGFKCYYSPLIKVYSEETSYSV